MKIGFHLPKKDQCDLCHQYKNTPSPTDCLYDFLNKLASKGVNEVNLWSDNCGGQNRNRIVYYMYLLAAKMFKMKISHHFMEKGHTQNEGNSVHALIEKTARGREVYSPDE